MEQGETMRELPAAGKAAQVETIAVKLPARGSVTKNIKQGMVSPRTTALIQDLLVHAIVLFAINRRDKGYLERLALGGEPHDDLRRIARDPMDQHKRRPAFATRRNESIVFTRRIAGQPKMPLKARRVMEELSLPKLACVTGN